MATMENVKCPSCRANAWPEGKYGYLACPNCKTDFLVGKHSIKLDRQRRRFLAPSSESGTKRSRDKAIINGLVMCACCMSPAKPGECIDGRIESDGTQRIDVPTGWTFTGSAQDIKNFVPHFESRTIPKMLRGW